MREAIQTFRAALDAAPKPDLETRGELQALGLALVQKLGEPYTYGLPGSDPNVTELPTGALVIDLIVPLRSGLEAIDRLHMRVPTLGDSKTLKGNSESIGDETQALIEKLSLVCTVAANNRRLVRSEVEGISEEDAKTLIGALAFLGGRFRRTGKIYRT